MYFSISCHGDWFEGHIDNAFWFYPLLALRISEGLIYYFSCTCLPLICSMVISNICVARPLRAICSSAKVSSG